jgi:hypothetical protein
MNRIVVAPFHNMPAPSHHQWSAILGNEGDIRFLLKHTRKCACGKLFDYEIWSILSNLDDLGRALDLDST